VAGRDRDCSKRMTVWCLLAMLLLTAFLISGYVLYESPGGGQPLQKQDPVPVRRIPRGSMSTK
jgi:hypothetical protein